MPIPQPAESLERLHAHVGQFDPFALTGFHDLVQLSGSLVLAAAVASDALTPQDAWPLSRIDEDFQISQWGDDEEAAEAAAIKQQAFYDAALFLNLSRST